MRTARRALLRHLFVAFGATIALSVATTARADLLTFSFTGTVDSVDAPLAATFSTGQSLSGTYTFDSTTVARAGSNSNFAAYDALTHVDFTVGGYSASSAGAQEIQVDNDPGAPFFDRYSILSRASDGLTGAAVAGLALDSFGFRLDDSTNTVFTDALILPTTLNLADFNNRQFFIFFNDSAGAPSVVSGTITSLRPVPEPSALLLTVVGGISGLGLWRRQRRRIA